MWPEFARWGRLPLAALLAVCSLLLSACAQLPRTPPDSGIPSWSGRLSLQVQSEPAQSFSAGFELKGNASEGTLVLNSPLGTRLLAARWSLQEALLDAGNETRRFASMDALIEETTGAALPVAALFDWLDGKATSLNGWTADMTRQTEGRIQARRSTPLPVSELRIVLDVPAL